MDVRERPELLLEEVERRGAETEERLQRDALPLARVSNAS